jgi:hypothetical protein
VFSKKRSSVDLDNLEKLHQERVRAPDNNPEQLPPIARDVLLLLLRGGAVQQTPLDNLCSRRRFQKVCSQKSVELDNLEKIHK